MYEVEPPRILIAHIYASHLSLVSQALILPIDLFDRPVVIEVPHFASLRGKEREIVILRSDNGETWREHTLEASEEAVQDVLNESFEGEGNETDF